jgi:hypothetical protein
MLFVLIVIEIKIFNQHYSLKIVSKHCTLSRKQLYGKLSGIVTLFRRVMVLDFDDFAGETFVRLRLQNPTLSKQRLQKDMRIAAIALALDAVVVTRNYRDFSLSFPLTEFSYELHSLFLE